MNRLLTIGKAKELVKKLQDFIALVENYPDDTLEKAIIKEYAQTGSIKEVVNRINSIGFHQGEPIDRKYVTAVIDGKPIDELHRIVRFGYREKIKQYKRVTF